MGWPEEPTSWGVPGHTNTGAEFEAIREQLRRKSAPIAGTRWVNGATIAAGIAGTEITSNIATGTGRFEAGRRYRVKVRVNLLATNTTDTFLFRIRLTSAVGTQIDDHTYQHRNTTYSWREYWESDFSPATDVTDTLVLTCQRLSGGAGTISFIAGATTAPVFMEVWDDGHTTDVTSIT